MRIERRGTFRAHTRSCIAVTDQSRCGGMCQIVGGHRRHRPPLQWKESLFDAGFRESSEAWRSPILYTSILTLQRPALFFHRVIVI